MKSNRLVNTIFAISAAVIIFGIGYRFGEFKASPASAKFQTAKQQTSLNNYDFSLFWETFENLKAKFVDKSKIDAKKMYYGAIKGMVSSLEDPYTFFLTPEENSQSKEDLEGKFEGIGAELGLKDNRIIIIAPLENFPAEKAGVKSGDSIEKVNGASTKGWTLSQAVSKIRGQKGTKVKLTLSRNGKEKEVSIVRDQIVVKSVKLTFESGVAILKLNQFGENTNNEWDKAIEQIVQKKQEGKLKGMVLDMRDNPGGYLDSSVYLASEFLNRGDLVVKQESTSTQSKQYKSLRDGKLQNIPLSILINQGSASASEIMAGALRDHKKAVLVGEKSFGKGSVQEALDLSEGAGLHVTVAKWILPGGDWINGKGIEPQIKITNEIKEGNTITKESDAQLKEAIDRVAK